jgi:hypothetical protein
MTEMRTLVLLHRLNSQLSTRCVAGSQTGGGESRGKACDGRNGIRHRAGKEKQGKKKEALPHGFARATSRKIDWASADPPNDKVQLLNSESRSRASPLDR